MSDLDTNLYYRKDKQPNKLGGYGENSWGLNSGYYGGDSLNSGQSNWWDNINDSGWGGMATGLMGVAGGLYSDWRKQKDYENYKKDWEKYNTYQQPEVDQMSTLMQQRLGQAKNVAIQQMKESNAMRGLGSGSGLGAAGYGDVNRAYMNALAQGFSQLPVAGTAKSGASIPKRPQNTEDAWLEGLGQMAYHSPQLIQWYMNWQNEKAKNEKKPEKKGGK